MASVKLVLRKEVKEDGTSPLAIRITKDRRSSYIYLEYSIKPEQWDSANQRVKKSHPNSARLNNFLLKKLSEITDKALELESTEDTVSSQSVRKKVKPTGGSSVFAQADLYLATLEADGKFTQHNSNKPRVKHLKEYLQHDIRFQDLTVPVLERYKAWLKNTYKMGERSAVNHLVVVRSIFSQAIKAKVVDARYYPFGKGKIKIKFPDSIKIGLSAEEVQRLEELDLTGSPLLHHARNIWLYSFYFAGMRVSDVLRLKWSDFHDDRLSYAMGKNAKVDSLKVPEKALRIMNEYAADRNQDNKHNLVFPDLRKVADFSENFSVQQKIASAVRRIDERLGKIAKLTKIEKPLTMHIARHTFGNLSGEKIPIQMLQKLYRHSSVTTTIGYQANFIHKDVDDALDSVINF